MDEDEVVSVRQRRLQYLANQIENWPHEPVVDEPEVVVLEERRPSSSSQAAQAQTVEERRPSSSSQAAQTQTVEERRPSSSVQAAQTVEERRPSSSVQAPRRASSNNSSASDNSQQPARPARKKQKRAYNYLDSLADGVNFIIVPGKSEGSKVVVHEGFGFTCDKRYEPTVGGHSSTPTYYVKCKYNPQCQARGQIKDKFLTMLGKNSHTCVANPAKWLSFAALGNMKKRALNERTTFEVSQLLV